MGWGGAPIAAASSRGVLRQNSEGERCNWPRPNRIMRAQGKVGFEFIEFFLPFSLWEKVARSAG